VRVRKRVEAVHLTAGTRECDAVSRGEVRVEMPFDQPRQGEEGSGRCVLPLFGGDVKVREACRNIVHILQNVSV